MRVLRWGLASLTLAYAVLASIPVALTWAFKTGLLGERITDDLAAFMAAIPWAMMIAWTTMGLLYLSSGVLQFRRDRRALMVFAAALVIDVVLYFVMSTLPSFEGVFSPQEDLQNRIILGFVAVLGVCVWWANRRAPHGRFKTAAA